MAKRVRKPPVRPETRRDWLKRNEEDGESPPQIAASDGFDIRTVRKQVQLARGEREVREARGSVLRNAVELHYKDLCRVADSVKTQVKQGKTAWLSEEDGLLWSALREHMPRSPLWRRITRWNQVVNELDAIRGETERDLVSVLREDDRLSPILDAGEDGAILGMASAITVQMTNHAQGFEGLNVNQHFRVKPAGEGYVTVDYGPAHMGKVQSGHEAIIREALVDYESKPTALEHYDPTRKLYDEMERLRRAVREELDVITLRRIVPGKCRYCPL